MDKSKIVEALEIGTIEWRKHVHVVASLDEETKTIYVITGYVPDIAHFNDDLKTRR